MRARTIFLILGLGLLTAFVVLNVDEFTRSSLLKLGFTSIQLPLGLVMLLLLLASVLIFVATTFYIQSSNLIESRKHTREMTSQRELANKAEASRFTELRNYFEAQAHTALQRDAENARVFNERLLQTQAALLHRLDQSDNATAAYIEELEDRLERNPALARTG